MLNTSAYSRDAVVLIRFLPKLALIPVFDKFIYKTTCLSAGHKDVCHNQGILDTIRLDH